MPKNQFLSKLNKPDYNNMFEEVLEAKSFTADTKSLLLSMLYKVETSYNDYAKVKRTVLDRNGFIEQIIGTIKYCCDDIMLVEPTSKIGKSMEGKIAKVEKSRIIAFPTEYALLTGIAELIPLDFVTDTVLSKELQKVLNIGYVSDTIETIYSFDGWTWNILPVSEYALLYQNIEILLGYDFMEQWRNGKKNIKKVKDRIFELYNGENQLLLLQELKKVLAKGFTTDFPEKAKEYTKTLKGLKSEFKKINNTAKYLEEMSVRKKELNAKIREIDTILLDKDLIKKKYEEENASRPLEKKIFSIRHYGQLLKNNREALISEIAECNKSIDPATLIERKETLKYEIDKYDAVGKALKEERSFAEVVIDFQSIFLKMLEVKVEKASTKKDLVDLIYILRYYKNIKLDSFLKDISEVRKSIDVLERQLLLKAVNSEVFCNLTENPLYSADILSEILDTNIIDLEEINIVPRLENNAIVLDIYDGEILDRTIYVNPDIKVIGLKQNKKSKLFN